MSSSRGRPQNANEQRQISAVDQSVNKARASDTILEMNKRIAELEGEVVQKESAITENKTMNNKMFEKIK